MMHRAVAFALASVVCVGHMQAQIGASAFDFSFVESRGSYGYTATRDGDYRFGRTVGGGVDNAGFDAASGRIVNADGSDQGTSAGFDIAQFREADPFRDSDTVRLSSSASAYAESVGQGVDTTTSLSDIRFTFMYDQPFVVRGSGFIRTARTDAGVGADGSYFGRILIFEGFGVSRRILNATISGSESDEIEFSFEQLVEPAGFSDWFSASIDLDGFASSSLPLEGAGYGLEAELVLEFFPVPAPASLALIVPAAAAMTRRCRP